MNLECIEITPPAEPVATVIVLHGLGADGTDFLPLADEIDLAAVGPVRWVLPRAPVRPVTINGGYPMRAWYDILAPDLQRREDEAGLRQSFAEVHELIEREIARGVPARRIVLAGFSQGAAITLGAGLRCRRRLAGLAALSGYLPLASSSAAERSEENAGLTVFGAHGARDGVVVPERGRAARDALEALGHPVQWHEYPMEHSVCAEEVRDLGAWLRGALA
ncbi:MAG: carboxylesterase [Burkholderiales bacterium]|nr:carboxylesterase [Burkholderiales bacterium]